jgi:rhodanese-related sulfurtransferase
MWKMMHALLGSTNEPSSALGSNATLINNDQLVAIYGQIGEKLIAFDLRRAGEVERFPYVIPGSLLTTRVNLVDLANWIPPEAVVVLCGAGRISEHYDLIRLLPQDAHFYLLEGGIKSWVQAQLPMEPVNQIFMEETVSVWKRETRTTNPQGEN